MPTKVCTKCQAEKPVDQYHHKASMKDGLASECKTCANARARQRYATDPKVKGGIDAWRCANGEKVREARKARYWRDPAANRAKSREQYAKNPVARKAAQQRWRVKNRAKQWAHDAVKYRVSVTGELPRPETLPCLLCQGPAQCYHHPDYNEPLQVQALCDACHMGIAHGPVDVALPGQTPARVSKWRTQRS